MQLVNRALGLLVAVIGVGLALWAPPAFEMLTGHRLPFPAANDGAAMVVWSGVAFLRVFGAVLFGIGAVLWSSNARAATSRGIRLALFLSSVFASLLVWSQQVAIWANSVGWALVGLFGVLAITTGLLLLQQSEVQTTGGAV